MTKENYSRSKDFLWAVIIFIAFLIVFPSPAYSQGIFASGDKVIPNTFQVVINFLAGLVLFLYGITKLTNGIKSIAGDDVKRILSRFTTNRFAGLLTGFVATTILDSSSLVIIMVIALVNAGALNSSQSLGVVLGANIGTTVSSQIIAFDLSLYSPIAMFIGFMMYSLGQSKKMKKIGLIIFGAGLIFFGLNQMGEAMNPLKENALFVHWMQNIENPILGIVVGAAFTVVIQSSSATLGVVIAMANQGMVSLPAGIALMMGAELGTCTDTLVATIGRSREAIKVGIFHLFFNLLSVIIGLVLFKPFLTFTEYISIHSGLTHQVANAHLMFNTLGAIIFIGFTPYISKGLNILVPERELDQNNLKYIQKKDKKIFSEKAKNN